MLRRHEAGQPRPTTLSEPRARGGASNRLRAAWTGPSDGSGGVKADVMAALPGWITARLIVVAALALSHFLVNHLHPTTAGVSFRVDQGLLGWDAGFYRAIASHGYAPLGHGATRFWPLVPLVARYLALGIAGATGVTLLIIANASALALGALLHRLVVVETGDRALARRAAWLIAVVPPAFVLVMGYAEATAIALAVGAFLALRTRRWEWAAAAGLLAGLTRPLGVLLVVPAAVEAARGWSGISRRQAISRVGAVAAPAVGGAIFLGWSWLAYGDPLVPLHAQQAAAQRGGFVDPVTSLGHEARLFVHGHIGSGLHDPWALGLVLLLVVCLFRWPASYTAFAAVTLLLALSSRNLDSLERYALSAFPLVLAGATLTASGRVERGVLALSAAGMAGYATLAFLNAYVP
jgi:hypothetical protein